MWCEAGCYEGRGVEDVRERGCGGVGLGRVKNAAGGEAE